MMPHSSDQRTIIAFKAWLENIMMDNSVEDWFLAHVRGAEGAKLAAVSSQEIIDRILVLRPIDIDQIMKDAGCFELFDENQGKRLGIEDYFRFLGDLKLAFHKFELRLPPGFVKTAEIDNIVVDLANDLKHQWSQCL
jgi:hypothetical protein